MKIQLKKEISPESRNTGPGFTLLEVMVALAVLTISLTSIYKMHSQTLMMSEKARFYNLAPVLAESKLSEIQRQGIDESTDNSGDFGQNYPYYTWTVKMEQVTSELLEMQQHHLMRIEITVSKNNEHTYNLRTYRFYVEE
ncbi:MAG: prepilin-type N-terminal cleavage/methylation domain-containing protein [Desulfobacteraceae bacterium]|nr:prepilin-type N-terminal cleavage/methylation domain-containing protein [Desulfobacteraceae bacterium]